MKLRWSKVTPDSKLTVREIVVLAIMASAVITMKEIISFIPNIELVSLSIIVFSLVFGKKVFYIIYIFVFVEGLLYGFNIWWISYLYVWSLLSFAVFIFKEKKEPAFWAAFSGAFGLLFGTLCEIPWFFIIGIKPAFAALVSGIPFDIIHSAGNFFIALFLFKPFYKLVLYLNEGSY